MKQILNQNNFGWFSSKFAHIDPTHFPTWLLHIGSNTIK
jgi:hypothetical protein